MAGPSDGDGCLQGFVRRDSIPPYIFFRAALHFETLCHSPVTFTFLSAITIEALFSGTTSEVRDEKISDVVERVGDRAQRLCPRTCDLSRSRFKSVRRNRDAGTAGSDSRTGCCRPKPGPCMDRRTLGVAARRLRVGAWLLGAAASPSFPLGAWRVGTLWRRLALASWALALTQNTQRSLRAPPQPIARRAFLNA